MKKLKKQLMISLKMKNDIEEDDQNNNDSIVQTASKAKGLSRELRNLQAFYNPDPGNTAEIAMLQRVFDPQMVLNTITGFNDGSKIPQSYFEAKQSKDWKKWKEAMYTGLSNMETKHVWSFGNKDSLPPGRKIIGNRWVYAIKDDGRLRARTVAKGFS